MQMNILKQNMKENIPSEFGLFITYKCELTCISYTLYFFISTCMQVFTVHGSNNVLRTI